jgi:hypothetical protein
MTHTLRYRGSPRFASQLVQMLEEEGVTVRWQPPIERKSLEDAATQVVVTIVAAGGTAAIRAAVNKFRERHPEAEVDWREGDAYR